MVIVVIFYSCSNNYYYYNCFSFFLQLCLEAYDNIYLL